MRYQGKITEWRDEQGFGFISPNGGGKQVFVHIKSLLNRKRRPTINEIVSYELAKDEKYRFQAVKVSFVDERSPSTSSSSSKLMPIFTVIFACIVAVLILKGRLPTYVFDVYLVVSLFTFLIYAYDKSAAKNNQQRTSENTLHIFALIGGWPGALVAQRMLRHKSNKQSFQVIYVMTAFINCGLLTWLIFSDMKLLHDI